jgi:hypothetical protein
MALHHAPSRSDAEIRALLQLLVASDGFCGDALLRLKLVDTGFVRRDPASEAVLHLTPEGRRFLSSGAFDAPISS